MGTATCFTRFNSVLYFPISLKTEHVEAITQIELPGGLVAVNNTSLITPSLLKYCLYPEDRVEIESHKKRCAGDKLDASEATKFYPVWEVKVVPG